MRPLHLVTALLAILMAGPAVADPPRGPDLLGDLESLSGASVADGSYPMTLTLFSSEESGDEVLVDHHEAVLVSEGRFQLQVGDGDVSDGCGPGVFLSLSEAVAQYGELWAEVTFSDEILAPRLLLPSVAYAFDARFLDGMGPDEFGDGNSLESADGTPEDALYVSPAGVVGIGTTNPVERLHLVATDEGALRLDSPPDGWAVLELAQTDMGAWLTSAPSDGSFRIFEPEGSNTLVIAPGGAIGIQRIIPSFALDLGGDLRLTGALRDSAGNPGTPGQVLQSTGTGIEWGPSPTTENDGDWISDGPALYSAVTGNVGIGTAAPVGKLTVTAPESDSWWSSRHLVLTRADVPTEAFALRISDDGTQDLMLAGFDETLGWTDILTFRRSDSKVGIGAFPKNGLDVGGSAAIGPGFAGVETAPPNSLIVEGKLGIGTNAPAATLQVSGGRVKIDGDRRFRFSDTELSDRLKLQLWSDIGFGIDQNGLFFAADKLSWRDGSGVERMSYEANADPKLEILGTGITRFNGPLGIGTTPVNTLDVEGGVAIGEGFAGVETGPSGGMIIEGPMVVDAGAAFGGLTIGNADLLVQDSEGDTKLTVDLASSLHDSGRISARSPDGTKYANVSHAPDSGYDRGGMSLYGDGQTWIRTYVAPQGAGMTETFGANEQENVRLFRWGAGYENHGSLTVHDELGLIQGSMFSSPSGNGVVSADFNFFTLDNPLDPQTSIRYCTLVGPEVAAAVRGRDTLDSGRALVELPRSFRSITSAETMTVFVTSLDPDCAGLAVVEKNDTGFVVEELAGGSGDSPFVWEATAVRRGFESFDEHGERPPDEPVGHKERDLAPSQDQPNHDLSALQAVHEDAITRTQPAPTVMVELGSAAVSYTHLRAHET